MRLLWIASSVALASMALAQGPRISTLSSGAKEVARYGRYEANYDSSGAWSNPFDPKQADVHEEFTAPSGHRSVVPAFFTQDYDSQVLQARMARRSVNAVKFFIEEKAWQKATDVQFYFDDLMLEDSNSGRSQSLDNMESGDATRWGSSGVSWATDLVHSGQRSLRFVPHITDVEHWPGPVMAIGHKDWSGFDRLVLWIYPHFRGNPGSLKLYLVDSVTGNSPIQTLFIGKGGLQPNRWNRIVWDWRGFLDTIQFHKRGTPHWQVRFTPTEVGTYRCRVVAHDAGGATEVEMNPFRCIPSKRSGFVRVSKQDRRYFAFDDGKPFLPIGHDVAWDLNWALRAFTRMAANGENATYCIEIPWETAIEWSELGRYDQERAAKVDTLIALAEANGIYLKLSFDVHDALRRGASWEQNPYASERGGPCKGPNDFYTDPRAKELYRNRLRYMLARWGYSPNVMAWETVAEIDGATEMPDGTAGWGYPTRPGGEKVSSMLIAWLHEMHGYMREQDPYGRLLTVSLGGDVNDTNLWRMPEVQYVQLHHYDSLNPGQSMPEWCRRLTAFGKPFLITESGWWADWNKPVVDPQGICLHDGMWASLLGGASGSAFSWWWEQIDALDIYPQYRSLRTFIAGIDWLNEGFRPSPVTFDLGKPKGFGVLSLAADAPFDGSATNRFVVKRSGAVEPTGSRLPQFLLAPDRRKTPATELDLDCPEPGSFRLHIDTVSPDARLQVRLDGKLVLVKDLPVQNVPGKVSTFDEKWKIWRCLYDEDVSIPLTAGAHRLELENSKPGGSWIHVTSYTLTRYSLPVMNVVAMAGRSRTLVWIQNGSSTWLNLQNGYEALPIEGATITLSGLRSGNFRVVWWDTMAGKPIKTGERRSTQGQIVLALPAIRHDLACRLEWLGSD
ncbi:MAG: hypothetical protein P4L46_12940 [Fimbriimonas sp.]|nr:hypothetical protein [Fimbriimonas sp.]